MLLFFKWRDTASSTHQNNVSGFGPQKAIDGDAVGYSFGIVIQ
jgi:hypothetical protein